MKVAELARLESVSADTIRHYVRVGLLAPQKDGSGYHIFNRHDVSRLRFILHARDLGFTLEDIRLILDEAGKGKSPCPVVRELIEPRLSEARKRLADMQALFERMESAVTLWSSLPDCEPCGDHICHLIEGDSEQLFAKDGGACCE